MRGEGGESISCRSEAADKQLIVLSAPILIWSVENYNVFGLIRCMIDYLNEGEYSDWRWIITVYSYAPLGGEQNSAFM